MRYRSFEAACNAQGVQVHPEVARAGQRGRSDLIFSVEPTAVHAAVAQAGKLLRTKPDEPLLNRPLKEPRHPFYRRASIAPHVLTSILNASLEPVTTGDGPSFTCRGVDSISVCESAEERFLYTFVQMQQPHTPVCAPEGISGYQIITDRNQPIAVRKARGERSTLSLAPMTINGIPYPAGSLLRMDLRQDQQSSDDCIYFAHSEQRIDISAVERAAFIRLSAFSEPPGSRRPFSAYMPPFAYTGRELFRNASIADLAELGRAALQHTETL